MHQIRKLQRMLLAFESAQFLFLLTVVMVSEGPAPESNCNLDSLEITKELLLIVCVPVTALRLLIYLYMRLQTCKYWVVMLLSLLLI